MLMQRKTNKNIRTMFKEHLRNIKPLRRKISFRGVLTY